MPRTLVPFYKLSVAKTTNETRKMQKEKKTEMRQLLGGLQTSTLLADVTLHVQNCHCTESWPSVIV
jgi:hypothetical protein